VLADEETCLFAAGLYANFGLDLYAVRAADGSPVWRQSDFGRGEGATAQGYLLADARRIVVPCGRTFPVVFDRQSGRFEARFPSGAARRTAAISRYCRATCC